MRKFTIKSLNNAFQGNIKIMSYVKSVLKILFLKSSIQNLVDHVMKMQLIVEVSNIFNSKKVSEVYLKLIFKCKHVTTID